MQFTERIFRPPQEAESLLLRTTQSCSYNDCHFCHVCRNSPFKVVSLEHIEKALIKEKPYYLATTPVYLVGANPLCLPVKTLLDIAQCVKNHVPDGGDISMQARIADIAEKSDEELKELRIAGFTHMYIGTENGNDAALHIMNKGVTATDAVCQLHRLDTAHIAYTLNYILGMAGQGQGEISAIKTAEMFNQVHPRSIATTGLTVFKEAPLYHMVASGAFVPATEREMVEELLFFVEKLQVKTLLNTRHNLNIFAIKVQMPEEKDRLMQELSAFLHKHSDASIQRLYSREKYVTL